VASAAQGSEAAAMNDHLTFDCYGTLIDWRSGIAQAFDGAVPGARKVPRDRLFAAYAAAEADLEHGSYLPYRQVLDQAASRAATALGLRVPAARRRFLSQSLPTWKPFPDTNPALRQLAAQGFRLGILSNVDDDLLAGTLRHLHVPFDLLITAEQLRSYKPAPAHFLAALDACAGDRRRLIHVAESQYHDIAAAEAVGLRTIWVNRNGLPAIGTARPTIEVRDLRGAAEWIAAWRAGPQPD